MQVDENLIAVRTPIDNEGCSCNFILLKTFKLERHLSDGYSRVLQSFEGDYDGGNYFLIKTSGFVRMLVVASGTFLHDMRIGPYAFYRIIVRLNSNCVVIAAVESNSETDCGGRSKLYV